MSKELREKKLVEAATTEAEKKPEATEQTEETKNSQPEEESNIIEETKNPQPEEENQITEEAKNPQPEEESHITEEAEATVPQETEKSHKGRNIAIILATVLLVMVIGAYGVITYLFSSRFLWGTKIDGLDCGGMTVVQTEEALQKQLLTYELQILGRDGLTDSIDASEVGMRYLFHNGLEEILQNQEPLLWFLGMWVSREYMLDKELVVDEDALEQAAGELVFYQRKHVKKPKSAYLSEYLPEQKGYTVISEENGSLLLRYAKEQIIEAVMNLEDSIDLEEQNLYVPPAKKQDNVNLQQLAAGLNRYTEVAVCYEFGEETVVLDGDTIHEWLSVWGSQVMLDKKAVADYVKNMAIEHNTYYNTRTITTTNGQEKQLRSCYGWLIDQKAETEVLMRQLIQGESATREPEYQFRGQVHSDTDIGDSYVEIDLGNQHLYLYIEDTLVLETDFVSGNMADQNGTPAGVYDVDYRTRDVILRGPTWETFVNYWMPFNGAVGMHDATWRREFGGDIYLTNGSHGCVNLPFSMAKQIYSYMYSGMPVICYY